jgi:hypothetical protein
MLGRAVRRGEVAARCQGIKQPDKDLSRLVVIDQEGDDRDEYHRDRLAEVQDLPRHLVGQDRLRVAQVAGEVAGAALGGAGQQCPRVRQHRRVIVDVDDPARRVHPLRDLVHIPGRGQAAADVEELPDARLGRQETYRAGEELPILPRHGPRARHPGEHPVRHFPVHRVVVLAPDAIVVDPRRVRPARVDPRYRRNRVCSLLHAHVPLPWQQSRISGQSYLAF